MTSRRRGTDRHLAAAFSKNARSFHAMARSQRDRHAGTSAYYLAIAIEVGLKAYLIHRGMTDQWNRVHLRHGLTKALKCVRRAGLKDVPKECANWPTSSARCTRLGLCREAWPDR